MARTPIQAPVASSSSGSESESEQEEQQAVKKRRVQFLDVAQQEESTVFVPPKGLKKASGEEILGDFGAEAIKQKLANGCELWAIRLPEGFKLRHFNEAKLKLPNAGSSKTQKLGTFNAKKTDYEVYSLGEDPQEAASVGAGEMKSLTALFADKRQKTYSAGPAQITRHLVVRQSLQLPQHSTAYEASDDEGAVRQQPEGLNGFFAPYGSSTNPQFSSTAKATLPSSQIPASSSKKKLKREHLKTAESDVDMQSSPAANGKKKKKKRKSEAPAEADS